MTKTAEAIQKILGDEYDDRLTFQVQVNKLIHTWLVETSEYYEPVETTLKLCHENIDYLIDTLTAFVEKCVKWHDRYRFDILEEKLNELHNKYKHEIADAITSSDGHLSPAESIATAKAEVIQQVLRLAIESRIANMDVIFRAKSKSPSDEAIDFDTIIMNARIIQQVAEETLTGSKPPSCTERYIELFTQFLDFRTQAEEVAAKFTVALNFCRSIMDEDEKTKLKELIDKAQVVFELKKHR